jgi:hypothetical protein
MRQVITRISIVANKSPGFPSINCAILFSLINKSGQNFYPVFLIQKTGLNVSAVTGNPGEVTTEKEFPSWKTLKFTLHFWSTSLTARKPVKF